MRDVFGLSSPPAQRKAVERPRRRTRDARPPVKYTAAAVRSNGGLCSACQETRIRERRIQASADLGTVWGTETFRLKRGRENARHRVCRVVLRLDAWDLSDHRSDLAIPLVRWRTATDERVRVPLVDYISHDRKRTIIVST